MHWDWAKHGSCCGNGLSRRQSAWLFCFSFFFKGGGGGGGGRGGKGQNKFWLSPVFVVGRGLWKYPRGRITAAAPALHGGWQWQHARLTLSCQRMRAADVIPPPPPKKNKKQQPHNNNNSLTSYPNQKRAFSRGWPLLSMREENSVVRIRAGRSSTPLWQLVNTSPWRHTVSWGQGKS